MAKYTRSRQCALAGLGITGLVLAGCSSTSTAADPNSTSTQNGIACASDHSAKVVVTADLNSPSSVVPSWGVTVNADPNGTSYKGPVSGVNFGPNEPFTSELFSNTNEQPASGQALVYVSSSESTTYLAFQARFSNGCGPSTATITATEPLPTGYAWADCQWADNDANSTVTFAIHKGTAPDGKTEHTCSS